MPTVYDDSILKKLNLFFLTPAISSNQMVLTEYEHITNDKIVMESSNFTMGLLGGKKFNLGSYVIPDFSVKIRYDGKNYKGKLCRVWLEFSGQTYGIIFGKVYKEELSAQRDILTIYISNIFSEAMNKKIGYNTIFGENQTITVENFYRNLLCETYIACGFFRDEMYQLIETIVEDFSERFFEFKKINIYKLDEDETLEISSIWKMFGEFVGAHIQISYPLVFNEQEGKSLDIKPSDANIKLVRIDNSLDLTIPKNSTLPSNELYPMGIKTVSNSITLLFPSQNVLPSFETKPLELLQNAYHIPPYYINCVYDEWAYTDYEAINFEFEDIAFMCVSNQNQIPQRIYEINGNKMFFNKSSNECLEIVSKVLGYLKTKKYIPSSLDMIFNPTFKPGDNIVITTSRNEILAIPILNCEVSGINCLRAKIESSATVE